MRELSLFSGAGGGPKTMSSDTTTPALFGRVVLDLCGGSGSWSEPYRQAGYDVRVVDPKEICAPKGWDDVRLLEKPLLPVHGILAAPPCTVFAAAGARWFRSPEDKREGLAVVDACLRIVFACRPQWWALENPVGKLRRYLGDPQLIFQPCDYGDPYTKRTLLWGNFAAPKQTPVTPTKGSKMWRKYGGKSEATKEARSKTPERFARAFFEANP